MTWTTRCVPAAVVALWLSACATPPTPGGHVPAQTPRAQPVVRSDAVPAPPAAPVTPAPEVQRAAEVPSGGSAAEVPSPVPAAVQVQEPALGKGLASWYGRKFHGRRTASGERYDRQAFTAAHRSLPFGTRIRVRSEATGKEVVVRVNDRGPFRHTRIIDLSEAAMNALGLRHRGVTAVELLPE